MLDMVPITIQEQPQPVAPLVNKNVIADLLDIVPDDIEINDEKKIEVSEDTPVLIKCSGCNKRLKSGNMYTYTKTRIKQLTIQT